MLRAKSAAKKLDRREKADELDARRRKQFIWAASKEFGKRGYHETTTTHIGTRAGVSAGLLYHYFEDKEDILFQSLSYVLDLYKETLPPAIAAGHDPLEKLGLAVRAYCRVIDANPSEVLLAYRETKSLSAARRNVIKQKEIETNKIIASLIRECIRAGIFDHIDVELFTYQVVMFCHTWALKAWRFKDRMTVEEYLDGGLDLLLRMAGRDTKVSGVRVTTK